MSDETEKIERDVLRNNYCKIISCIDVQDIVPYLYQKNIININEKERILKIGTIMIDKAEELVDKLIRSEHRNAFPVFLEALDIYNAHLAADLRQQLVPTRRESVQRQQAFVRTHMSSENKTDENEQCCVKCQTRVTSRCMTSQRITSRVAVEQGGPDENPGINGAAHGIAEPHGGRLSLSGGCIGESSTMYPVTDQKSHSYSQPYGLAPKHAFVRRPVQETHDSEMDHLGYGDQTLCKTIDEEQRTVVKEATAPAFTRVENVCLLGNTPSGNNDNGYSSPEENLDYVDTALSGLNFSDQSQLPKSLVTNDPEMNNLSTKAPSLKRKGCIKKDVRCSTRSARVLSPTVELQHQNISNDSCEDNRLVSSCPEPTTVTLERRQGDRFGFSFVSGKPEGRPRYGGDSDYYVTKVDFGTIAFECGQIKHEDTILSINGHRIRDWEKREVIEFLGNNDTVTIKLLSFKIQR